MAQRARRNPSGVATSAGAASYPSWAHLRSLASTVLVAVFVLSASVRAERLPVRVYTIADGLPSTQIACDRRDSYGFIWFCTPEGLSRFDGYTFTNYGVEQGLPDRNVTDFLQTRGGVYWVGTARGVARFNPKPSAKEPMFTVYGSKETGPIDALLEDHQGTVWITAKGIFQLAHSNGDWSLRRAGFDLPADAEPENLLDDHNGVLWITVYQKGIASILRRSPDGTVDIVRDDFFTSNRIIAIAEDLWGRIWLGTYKGLALTVAHPKVGSPLIEHVYTWEGGPTHEIGALSRTSDGQLWVGSSGKWRQVMRDDRGQVRFRLVRTVAGIHVDDREGNLWFSNRKTLRNGFVSYGLEDGLADEPIHSVFEGQDGQLYVVSGIHNRHIQRFDGDHFTAVAPKVLGHDPSWDWEGWGWGQIHLQDHNGEWWVATEHSLLRYPRVARLEDLAHTVPKSVYPMRNLFRLYEDSRGDIWIGRWDGLQRWERSTGRFHNVDVANKDVATAFREDRAGNLWVGFWGGGISRYRQGHLISIVTPKEVAGAVFSLFLDHAGRLWAGTTRSGLLRIDNPTAEKPIFTLYSVKDGLSSVNVRAITEDHFGRVYLFTGRGVDRLDPETGKIRHYTEANGLIPAGADHNVAFCDRKGRLWFGLVGLSRLDPEPDPPSQPPPIRVTKLRVGGVEYPLSELGETNLSGLVLQPHENQLQIEFASLNFAAANAVTYQYKLDGAENEWSAPTDLRTVNYPRLSSGRYRFLVRAMNAEGLVSTAPASIAFRLLPPVWMRWWFLTALGLLAISGVYLAYRFRLQQLLAVERVRIRIATDLHDDIGSSLTQIAIISELTRRNKDDPRATERLIRISDLSRELVDSMSDIVWAINPKRDHLSDLIQRMRYFSTEVLEAAKIEVGFVAPLDRSDIPLQADVRREVFLVFKESLNNIVRHAQCKRVDVHVDLEESRVVMKIRDDGLGFDTRSENGRGHGLASMRVRAQRLGGTLEVSSEPGRGASLTLSVPIGRFAHSHR